MRDFLELSRSSDVIDFGAAAGARQATRTPSPQRIGCRSAGQTRRRRDESLGPCVRHRRPPDRLDGYQKVRPDGDLDGRDHHAIVLVGSCRGIAERHRQAYIEATEVTWRATSRGKERKSPMVEHVEGHGQADRHTALSASASRSQLQGGRDQRVSGRSAARAWHRCARHDVGDRRRRAHRGRGAGLRIALRADIDSLPITGGHRPAVQLDEPRRDATAAAMTLHEPGFWARRSGWPITCDRIAGSVKIVFQPVGRWYGRPQGRGIGATDDVKAIIGTHNKRTTPPDRSPSAQPMMAGCVKFQVTLRPGHPCRVPAEGHRHRALASMILALQTIVSRNISPFHAVVLSITEVHGGHVCEMSCPRSEIPGHRALLRPGRRTAMPAWRSRTRPSVRDRGRRTGTASRCRWSATRQSGGPRRCPPIGRSSRYIPAWRGGFRGVLGMRGAWCSRSSARNRGDRGAPTGTALRRRDGAIRRR